VAPNIIIPPARGPTRGQLTSEQLNAIDSSVGAEVRLRRILLGMSLEAVSKVLGLNLQQLHKYEHGTNRISGSRLYQLSQILHIPVSSFFKTVDPTIGAAQEAARGAYEAAAQADEVPSNVMRKRKTIELARAFYAIDDDKQRTAALNLLKTFARAGTHETRAVRLASGRSPTH
jgi:transcriptional regulator with XRE-family HTH domain